MKWLGKLVGALVGLALLRQPLGLLLGALAGHLFDSGLISLRRRPRLASSFVDPLFAVAGAVAKADGRVSDREIAAVEQLMRRMGLDAVQREAAITQFNAGKSPGFDATRAIELLRIWCLGRRDHAYVLLDVLLDLVFADGADAARQQFLRRVAAALNVREPEIAVLAATKGHAWAAAGSGAHNAPPQQPGTPDPYAVLGVERSADERSVKRAWRKRMSEHHPDKLGDVPAPLRERAEQRAREINAAYERIKSERGFH